MTLYDWRVYLGKMTYGYARPRAIEIDPVMWDQMLADCDKVSPGEVEDSKFAWSDLLPQGKRWLTFNGVYFIRGHESEEGRA